MNTTISPVLILVSTVFAGIVIWPGIAISQLKETAQTPAKTLSSPQLNSNMLQKCQQAVQSIPSCNYSTGTQTGTGPDVCTGQPIDNFGVNPVGTQYCVTALFKQYPKCLEDLQEGNPDCVVDASSSNLGAANNPVQAFSGPQINPNVLQKCQQAVQSILSCNYTTGTQTGTGPDVCTEQPIDNFGVNPVGTQHCVAALFKQYPKCLEDLQKGNPDCLVTK